jgi:uncharacterized protein YecE (DUF72 family)
MRPDLSANASPEDIWDEQGRQLPQRIYLGTSTWAFPDWKGILYRDEYKSERAFAHNSLAEYARVPWFRTVCIDSLFYNPPRPEVLKRYASQIPEDFRWISKVWERITIHTYPTHARYGARAGQKNPDFLNADLFEERVLNPYCVDGIQQNTGPFVFQFTPFSERLCSVESFLDSLENFLDRLPRMFRYAVEVRNADLICPRYVEILNKTGVTHCFNHWSAMIPLHDQMTRIASAGGLAADFFVARLLTPIGISYENAEKLLSPYTSLQRVNPGMRGDVLKIVRRASQVGKDLFVTANNKAEGNAPLTMVSLGKLILSSQETV